MEKGYKMHLRVYIRMFWNNAYYAIKGNIRKENIKVGEEWDTGQKVMLGVSGPQSLEKKWWPVILQTRFSLVPRTSGIPEQTPKALK